MSAKSFGAVLVSCLYEAAKEKPEEKEEIEKKEGEEITPEEKKEETPGFPAKMFQKRFGQKKK